MTKKEKMYERIEQHGENLKRIFGLDVDAVKLCKKLFSLEHKAHKITTDACNGDIFGDDLLIAEENILKRLCKIIGPANAVRCFINGDARGCALKLSEKESKTVEIYKDWGGCGILAPDFREET